jgi:uncharacterized protein YgiM (DUF1202 family)
MSSIDKDLNSLDETMKREIGQLQEQLQSHNLIITNYQTQKGQLDQEEREHSSELIDVSKACTTLFEQKSRVFDLLVAENVRIQLLLTQKRAISEAATEIQQNAEDIKILTRSLPEMNVSEIEMLRAKLQEVHLENQARTNYAREAQEKVCTFSTLLIV